VGNQSARFGRPVVAEESKMFFFEKKNQKTFGPLREVVKWPGAKINKVVLQLFVYRKKCFLV
jgi:hypothetical protein